MPVTCFFEVLLLFRKMRYAEQPAVYSFFQSLKLQEETRRKELGKNNECLNSRTWVCSFLFWRGLLDQRHMDAQILYSQFFPGAKATIIWNMLAIQVNTQALVMNIICSNWWAGTASTFLPPYSNKVRLCYHLIMSSSLGWYSSVYLLW